MLRFEFQQHQRQSEMIVEIAFRFQHPETRRQHVRNRFLGGGLAGRSGDPDQRLSPQSAHRRAQRLQRDQRIVHRQQPRSRREYRCI